MYFSKKFSNLDENESYFINRDPLNIKSNIEVSQVLTGSTPAPLKKSRIANNTLTSPLPLTQSFASTPQAFATTSQAVASSSKLTSKQFEFKKTITKLELNGTELIEVDSVFKFF